MQVKAFYHKSKQMLYFDIIQTQTAGKHSMLKANLVVFCLLISYIKFTFNPTSNIVILVLIKCIYNTHMDGPRDYHTK